MISHSEILEKEHNLNPKESNNLKETKQEIHKKSVFQNLEEITNIFLNMGLAFLCAEKNVKFLTSDDPCNLFNPDLQWQKFYGPGLAQKNIQVTMPLSPQILLCFSWTNLRGYISWNKKLVEDSNRMLVGHCYKYFISSESKIRRMWYRKYPLDLFFIIKIIKNKYRIFFARLKMKYKHRHVNKK